MKNNTINKEEKIIKKLMVIPETKIKTDQTNKTNKVCPISGCKAKNKTTIDVIKKEKIFKINISIFFTT